MIKFLLMSDRDPNDSFTCEGDTAELALVDALRQLGWGVYDHVSDDDEPEDGADWSCESCGAPGLWPLCADCEGREFPHV